MARPKYRYRVLVDGNNKFMVTRTRAQFRLLDLIFGMNRTEYAYYHYQYTVSTRGGLNPSPEPTVAILKNGYEWRLRAGNHPHSPGYTQDFRFPDAVEAIKALNYLREKDREKLQADEVIQVMEETL